MEESFLSHLTTFRQLTPDKKAATFIDSGPNGGTISREISYHELETLSDQLAVRLLEGSLKKGDRAVLVFPPSLDFLIAFIACLKAGIISVPVFPPNPTRKDTLLMFSKICYNSKAKVALTNKSYSHMKKLATLKQSFSLLNRSSSPWPDDLDWIVIDSETSSNKPISTHLLNKTCISSDIAFLQYTSGSTSDPKGVMITHSNLLDNLKKIIQELKAGPDTVVCSWLPQYHDMGLIGSYLGSIFCGGTGYYMSPLAFLQRPMMWIEAISRFHATHLQAPNFAFKLTARKFNASAYKGNTSELKLDLSSVQHIINAAEPVTEESIDAFLTAFKPFGLKGDVMFPTYGLAEHTVFVCSGGKQRLTVSKEALEIHGTIKVVESADASPETTSRLIGCGFPSNQGVDVRIVDPESLSEKKVDQVGEIWIHSDSKAAGYYNLVEETKKDFFATISDDQTLQYLRTGDLGFLHNDELFICGRIKDLIILGGRNYYPQDVESTAESCSELLRPGCSAAFTIDPISGDSEQVALVAELRDLPPLQELESVCGALVEKIKSTVNHDHSLSLSSIVLLRPKTIPKTTSGKIARSWCRKAYLSKKLDVVYSKAFSVNLEQVPDEPSNIEPTSTSNGKVDVQNLNKAAIIKLLSQDISRITGASLSSIKKNESMVSFMDSISMSQFKGLLEAQYGTQISDEYLFREDVTLNKLSDVVRLGFAADDQGGDGQTPSSSANSSSGGGVGGALGCPPGVCCTIL